MLCKETLLVCALLVVSSCLSEAAFAAPGFPGMVGSCSRSVLAQSGADPPARPLASEAPTIFSPGNYSYTILPGAIVPGTVDTGNHADDASTLVLLPFTYTLYDEAFTSVRVGSNGYLAFGTTNDSFNPGCIPVAVATFAIGPYWTDQLTNCAGCGIFTSTSGVAPNRIFNIEWRTNYFNSSVALNYEVRLYESQPSFDLIYGTVNAFVPPSARSLNVGVQKDAVSAKFTTIGACDQTTGGTSPPVSAGQLYHFTLPSGNYSYSVGSGSIVAGTVDIGNHGDDPSTFITLPFGYEVYGVFYSGVNAGSNGNLVFGTGGNSFAPNCLPVTGATYAIAPYWTDQCTGACLNVTCNGCGIFTSTSGAAPNRIFNIEWRTRYYNSGGDGVPLNYEVRLYEGQQTFDLIYGTINTFPLGDNLTLGIQRDSTSGKYTPLGECDATGGTKPPVISGQLFRFTLPNPVFVDSFEGIIII